MTIDATTVPATVYAGLAARSGDHGVTWSPLTSPVAAETTSGLVATAVTVDPFTGILYGATVYPIGLFQSNDHGQSWHAANSPVTAADAPAVAPQINSLIPANTPGTLYAIVQNVQSSAFVTELSPDGASIIASTLLHGHPSMNPAQNFVFGPTITSFVSSYATAISLDPAGNIVVAGGTRSNDFPMANASQPFNAGRSDAFAAVLAAGSNRLIQSTYIGGTLEDEALAAGVDSSGNVIVAGQTYSSDFPVTNAALPAKPHAPYAFLTKLAPPARGYTSHLCRVPLLIPERCEPVMPPARSGRLGKALPE